MAISWLVCSGSENVPVLAASFASTPATMRSQRAPANENASPIARSTSRDKPSRSRPRARKKRVRTVASGMSSAAATSSTLNSSTARSMNTVRNASGSMSMRASISRRTSERIAARLGLVVGVVHPSIPASAGRSIPSRTRAESPARRRRRSRPSASLMTMRTSQVDSFESARNVASARQARR